MKQKKLISLLVLLFFSLSLTSPVFAGTFTLQWEYTDEDGVLMTQWRWWFDTANFDAPGTIKGEGLIDDATQVGADKFETKVDTTGLTPDGPYTLKLQAHDGTEWSLEDTRTINLDTTVSNITVQNTLVDGL